MTTDEAAVETMARVGYEARRGGFNARGGLIAKSWEEADPATQEISIQAARAVLSALSVDPPPALVRAALERIREPSESMQKAGLLANVFENRRPDGRFGCPGVECPVEKPKDWLDPANAEAVKDYLAAPKCRIARLTMPADRAWRAMIDARLAELSREERDGGH